MERTMYLLRLLLEPTGVLFGVILLLVLNNYIFSKVKPSVGNGNIVNRSHENHIEIVSPSFMNQRRIENKEFIPVSQAEFEEPAEPVDEASPEELIFDEAIKSEEVENKRETLQKIDKKQDFYKTKLKKTKNKEEIATIKAAQERLEDLKTKIEKQIEEEK